MKSVAIPLPILSDRTLSPVAKVLWCGVSLCEGCPIEASAQLVGLSDYSDALEELVGSGRVTIGHDGSGYHAVMPVDKSAFDRASGVLERVSDAKGRVAQTLATGKAKREHRRAVMEERRSELDHVDITDHEGRVDRDSTSTHVESWFRDEIKKVHGPIRVSRWGVKERALAKALLEDFGEDILKRGIAEWVKEPAKYIPGFGGVATLPGLWGCRNAVMSAVQGVQALAPKKGHEDEYQAPRPGTKKMGW